jgi:ParB-like chromosome segregation protein Spo0J
LLPPPGAGCRPLANGSLALGIGKGFRKAGSSVDKMAQFFVSDPSEIRGSRWQVMRPLTEEEYASLKDGISQDGIVSSIVLDSNGDVIDGHTRLEIWGELLEAGEPAPERVPVIRRNDLTEPKEIKAAARKLNLQRRQLSQKDRRAIVKAQIVETPERSDNAVARMLGVDHSVAKKMREEAVGEGLIAVSPTSADTRGREQARVREHANNANVSETETLANNANVSETEVTPDPVPESRHQTTMDEQIEVGDEVTTQDGKGVVVENHHSPVMGVRLEGDEKGAPPHGYFEEEIARSKSVGEKTVREGAKAAHVEPPEKPKLTPEQRAYYDLFPYLNGLLSLDPAAVARAAPGDESAELNRALFKEVLPWFEKFFGELAKKPVLHAVE